MGWSTSVSGSSEGFLGKVKNREIFLRTMVAAVSLMVSKVGESLLLQENS